MLGKFEMELARFLLYACENEFEQKFILLFLVLKAQHVIYALLKPSEGAFN